MKEINVTGQKRTDLGKKASKTLRKEVIKYYRICCYNILWINDGLCQLILLYT